ncbi:3'(2'),5'-bisphosphate nucleotidase CysQ family protein [Flammeovirga aprica]|uniref:Inositol monophosphatase n=1 Tax=Flammeovirga aprica JL-4 TaxID=694437 RepID=A0A7X9RT61_9BACT|nr:inositol monophosphatase family protein [Flammeovirga aprica]NME67966.1 inositol monophosphatase [Flammeovirga aprica JL-4]
MGLSTETYNLLLQKGIEAALEAGKIIQSFDKKSLNIDKKETFKSYATQVVTEVDFLSQEKILEILTPTILKYDLGLLTEESQDNESRFNKDFFWCIDPLDGTLPYIEQNDGYSVSIALVNKDGKSIMGIIYNPQTDSLYYNTHDNKLYKNNKLFQLPEKENDLFLVFDRGFMKRENINMIYGYFKKLNYPKPTVVSHGGACMNAIWVLESKARAAYFKLPKKEKGGGSLWDFAATSALFGRQKLYGSDIKGCQLNINKSEPYFNEEGIIYTNDPTLMNDIILLNEILNH